MNKILISTSILIVLLPFLMGILVRAIPSGFQPSSDFLIDIYQNNTLSQTFTGLDNNLSMIAVSVKNPNIRNHNDLKLTVKDLSTGEVRVSALSGRSIPDGDLVKFKFDPLVSSKGHQINLVFSSPDSYSNQAFSIYCSKEASGKLLINAEPRNGELAFISYYKNQSPLGGAVNIASSFFWRLFKEPVFLSFYLILIGAIIVLLLSRKLPDFPDL